MFFFYKLKGRLDFKIRKLREINKKQIMEN